MRSEKSLSDNVSWHLWRNLFSFERGCGYKDILEAPIAAGKKWRVEQLGAAELVETVCQRETLTVCSAHPLAFRWLRVRGEPGDGASALTVVARRTPRVAEARQLLEEGEA